LFNGENRTPYVKDGIIECVVLGRTEAVNPKKTATKAATHYRLTVAPGKCETVRVRLTAAVPKALGGTNGGGAFGNRFDAIMKSRRTEADEFYATRVMTGLPRRENQPSRYQAGEQKMAFELLKAESTWTGDARKPLRPELPQTTLRFAQRQEVQ
jgi:hypothetical protein